MTKHAVINCQNGFVVFNPQSSKEHPYPPHKMGTSCSSGQQQLKMILELSATYAL